MKNKKGEIATLLTLGLVVVGTLITLGTSLFVNNKKNIPSNPRAVCQIPESSKACCFCKKGKVTVYASSTSRQNNCMGTACTTAAYGNAYGASSWGYCNNSGGSYEGGSCTSSGGGTPVPGTTLTPEPGCTNTNCQAFANLTSGLDIPVSYKGSSYYTVSGCPDDDDDSTKFNNADGLSGWCSGETGKACIPNKPCSDYDGFATQNYSFDHKGTAGAIQYYKNGNCGGTIVDLPTVKTYCTTDQNAEPTATPTPTETPAPTKKPPILGGETITFGSTKFLNCFTLAKLKDLLDEKKPAEYCTNNEGTIGDKNDIPYCCW